MTVQEPALCFLSGMCGIFVPIIGFQAGRKYLGVPILEMFAQRSNYGMSMRFCAGACREMRGAHILIILSPDPVQNFDFKSQAEPTNGVMRQAASCVAARKKHGRASDPGVVPMKRGRACENSGNPGIQISDNQHRLLPDMPPDALP